MGTKVIQFVAYAFLGIIVTMVIVAVVAFLSN